jgi:4-hydroxy-tetrahydrodipicolinate reductase
MGGRIAALASKDRDFEIRCGLEALGNPSIGKDIGELIGIGKLGKKVENDFNKVAEGCDVLIEFTTPSATMSHLEIACRNKVAMVIGTTALSTEQIEKIKRSSKEIVIVFSPNMSIGANLLFKLTEVMSKALSKDYKVEIIEAHHVKKKDAPSGTAKRLAEAVLKVRGEMPPIQSIREGDIVGDHSVIFTGEDEKIELKHSTFSRDTFARGALDAARFVMGKKTGLYSMQDVIEISLSSGSV